MAKPKRDPRTGRYLKRNAPKSKPKAIATARKPTARAKPKTFARSYRGNPATPDVVKMFKDGTITAAQILIGKATARSVPDLLGFARAGTPGLAIQAAVAIAAGYVASMFLGARAGAAILAGGITAPLETIVIQEGVPWLGPALTPTLAGYVPGGGNFAPLGAYPRRKALAGYVQARNNAAAVA